MKRGNRPCSQRLAALVGSLMLGCLVLGGSTAAAAAALPTTDEELLATLRTALEGRDLAAFEELVNWEGASKMRRRVVSYQLRYGFGRPIRSMAVEPFPTDDLRTMEAQGRFRANMPISQQVRVVFDEPANLYGKPPTAVFLVGRMDDTYRIALVVPRSAPKPD